MGSKPDGDGLKTISFWKDKYVKINKLMLANRIKIPHENFSPAIEFLRSTSSFDAVVVRVRVFIRTKGKTKFRFKFISREKLKFQTLRFFSQTLKLPRFKIIKNNKLKQTMFKKRTIVRFVMNDAPAGIFIPDQ